MLGLESGFETDDTAVISEQDILGDRLVRQRRGARRPENFIAEVTSLSAGDLVVHVDHGIGRFTGLRAIEAAGAPHDCLELHYAGGDKLFLPVENIELLSRYGSEETAVDLDRLGGGAWQARKARMKSRIREIANELIKIAAERQMREAPRLTVEHGPYDEFCAGFPYEETDDQQAAIDTVVAELASGRPMDRLICGDVGFGKTEVALRAAFIAAMNGRQVAVVVPTTLLARQHTKTFTDRFRGFPIKIGHASRLVSGKELTAVKKGIADGTDGHRHRHPRAARQIDLVQGPRSASSSMRSSISASSTRRSSSSCAPRCTCSRSPRRRSRARSSLRCPACATCRSSPRLRSTGLAVRTFMSPFDPLVVREALLRERYRGGQCFYVCPRIEDLAGPARVPAAARARTEGRGGARPDAADRARRHHVGLLRRQIRPAAVHLDHGIRPRHPERQYPDRAPRRPLRPVAALSAARPGRPRQGAGLCAVHLAGRTQDHRSGREATEGAAIARHPRRRLPARLARSRHPRRRQSPGRGAVRPHQGGRLRALPADAGRGGGLAEGRHHARRSPTGGRRRSPSARR